MDSECKWAMEWISGKLWHYTRAPLRALLMVPLKTKVWHLLDSDREYVGNFKTKTQMTEFIHRQSM